MEKVEITARFDTEGQVSVLSFVAGGRTYQVDDTGRQWQGSDGLHVLVMSDRQVYELVFHPDNCTWSLNPRLTIPKAL